MPDTVTGSPAAPAGIYILSAVLLAWSAVMWHDNLIFSEYFHGDNGAAIGKAQS